jgi:outer membrane immunogenic protein
MKKMLFAGIALAAQIAGPAAAADLPIKTPVYNYTPAIYSWWTGCYLGANIGGAWSRPHYTHDNSTVIEDFTFKPVGLIGGGQLGCQYQWTNLVFGVEGTWSQSNVRQSQRSLLLPNRERSINIDQIATATGRLGYTWDRTMIYAKAGWAGVKINARAVNLTTSEFSDFTSWNSGWTVGAGLEHVPWQNIIVGLEFNYYGVSFDHSGVDNFGVPVRNFNTSAPIYALTARMSYLFGPPVVTNY